MPAPFCTVETDSEEAAREAGAKQLGVPPGDVEVKVVAEGRYRVEVVRAPFVIEVAIGRNGMEGLVERIAPALGDAPQPTRADVLCALADGGITTAIQEKEIDRMLELVVGRRIEQRGVVVARGERPVRGRDGTVTRHYERSGALAAGRAGSAWTVVRDGELVIEREPATAGTAGFTVSGNPLPAQAGENPEVAVGPGIEGEADGRSWRARVPGFGYLELEASGVPRVVPAVTLSADRLAAHADLRSPGADEAAVAPAELGAAIAAAGVVHGLQARFVTALWNAVRTGKTLRRVLRIALGTPPEAGRDAGIEFAVPVGMRPGAIDAKTGSIDYRERRLVPPVRKDGLVGTWLPATPGVSGVGVDGAALPPAHGAKAELVLGEHVRGEEAPDGSIRIFARIDGAVIAPSANQVDVVDLLELPKDVDYSTGNIQIRGCVLIRGTVRSGFCVAASEDIEIDGSIEDAVVEAGGALTVGGAILGGDVGRVSARRGVSAHHAQNAKITCGADVAFKSSALNCAIECAGKLVATDGPGRLAGGRFTATHGVFVRELGSAAEVSTIVAVGMSPAITRRMREVRVEQHRVRAKGTKLQRSLGSSSTKRPSAGMPRAKSADARRLMKARRELAKSESALRARKKHLERSLFDGEPPVVEVGARIYAGVQIRIIDAFMRIDEARGAARYRYDPETRRIAVDAL